jgi:signal transduction histidine kinase
MTLAEKVFESQRPLAILNLEKNPAHPADLARKYGFTSYLGVPLSAKEERLGVIGLFTKGEHEFTAQEIEFLNTLAGQAAIAIHNARLFEETKKQAIELERSNKVKDEFLSVISHELRTPLNIISGYTTLLRDKTLGEVQPEQQDALKKIEGQSRDLLMMVDSILDVTLLETQREPLANNDVNIDALLSEVRADCAVFTQKELDIVCDYAHDLPVVTADSKKLKRILQNLIHNAVKFTAEGQITISAKLRDTPSNRATFEPKQSSVGQQTANKRTTEKWLEVKVTDTGVGIPSEAGHVSMTSSTKSTLRPPAAMMAWAWGFIL